LAPVPYLIVCDQPVSALDVSVQAQILALLADLRRDTGSTLLFISQDLGVVHHVSDRVLVMRNGRVIESGDVGAVFTGPKEEYTRELLAAAIPGTGAWSPSSASAGSKRSSASRQPPYGRVRLCKRPRSPYGWTGRPTGALGTKGVPWTPS
jgi:ABC-type dipeptide/oligopeptide/nickel transport system ATPase component